MERLNIFLDLLQSYRVCFTLILAMIIQTDFSIKLYVSNTSGVPYNDNCWRL